MSARATRRARRKGPSLHFRGDLLDMDNDVITKVLSFASPAALGRVRACSKACRDTHADDAELVLVALVRRGYDTAAATLPVQYFIIYTVI